MDGSGPLRLEWCGCGCDGLNDGQRFSLCYLRTGSRSRCSPLAVPTIRRAVMLKKVAQLHRRRFLKTGLAATGAAFVAPTIIPSSALGKGGAVAPSERIVVGGIGIGNRGTYDLGCFLEQKDVQF